MASTSWGLHSLRPDGHTPETDLPTAGEADTAESPCGPGLATRSGRVLSMRTITLVAVIALHVGLAAAQDVKVEGKPIEFASVSAALKALEARDGDGTVVTHSDGWTIINEPPAAAQWSFVPQDHPAYPAVVRRIIRRGPGGAVSVETSSLCEAPQGECTKMLAEFASMNERISQAVKARGRQGSTQPTP